MVPVLIPVLRASSRPYQEASGASNISSSTDMTCAVTRGPNSLLIVELLYIGWDCAASRLGAVAREPELAERERTFRKVGHLREILRQILDLAHVLVLLLDHQRYLESFGDDHPRATPYYGAKRRAKRIAKRIAECAQRIEGPTVAPIDARSNSKAHNDHVVRVQHVRPRF